MPKSAERTVKKSKFELIAELGRGGMATVYLARARRRPEKLIVLKQLRPDLVENADFLAMFLEEARLAGRLRHPNIVETFEVGKDEDKYYIAMEYLDGLSLQAVLTKYGWKGPFSFARQVFVLIEALRALEHAYTQCDDDGTPMKIVHRDVSPPNIILTFDGQVKLVDFGIAKAANSTVETRTGLIKGKLTYMAPEQAASGDVDLRTDIYSVGVMLWQAAAGKRRWKGIDNTEVLKRLHAGKVADSPRAELNGLPASVDQIVLKAIAPEPEDRYASASELRGALETLLADLGSKVGSKDLATFMASEFRAERARAASIMDARVRELDGSPREDDSVTAIRRSPKADDGQPKRRSPEAQSLSDAAAANHRTGQAPTKISRASATLSEAAESRSTTAPGRYVRSRRRRALWLGVVIVASAIAALAVWKVPKRLGAVASPAPARDSSLSTTDLAPSSPSSSAFVRAPPTPTISAPLAPTTSPAPDTGTDPNGGGNTRGQHSPSSRRPLTRGTAPPPSVPSAVAETPAPQRTPSAAASTAPSPQAQPSDTEHPTLDKQDPWKQRAIVVEKTDPWLH